MKDCIWDCNGRVVADPYGAVFCAYCGRYLGDFIIPEELDNQSPDYWD